MSLNEKCMLASLDIGIPSGRKIDKDVSNKVAQEYGIDSRLECGNFNKIIINARYLNNLQAVKRNATKVFEELTLPWVTGRVEFRLMPNKRYLEWSSQYRKFKSDFEKEKNFIGIEYESMIDEAKDRLRQTGGLFRRSDYPSSERFLNKVRMEHHIRPVPDSHNLDLRVADGYEEAQRIRDDVAESMRAELQRTNMAVYDRVYDAVAHMNSVLSNEKPKIHQTLTEKMKRLVDILPDLNLNDDENLEEIRQEIIKELLSTTAIGLRNSESKRKEVVEAGESIIKKMEKIYGTRA